MSLLKICKKRRQPLYFHKIFAIVAVELMIAFSSFGYVFTDSVSLTFMHIPVLIGALFLGPVEGMFFGAVFGLTSIWQAATIAVTSVDVLFSPFASGKPVASLFLSIGCRMAFGLFAGVLFMTAKRQGIYKKQAVLAAAVIATFFHTLLVYMTIHIFFADKGTILYLLPVGNVLLNLILTGLMIYVLYLIHESDSMRSFSREIGSFTRLEENRNLTMVYFVGVMILLALSLFFHFYGRVEMVLLQEGIVMSEAISKKFSQIGLQFVVAIMSLSCLMAMLLLFFEQYSKSMAAKSEWDAMTKTYNKGAMFKYAEIKLARRKPGSKVTYMMVDVDDFKRINDTYGHPYGDMVLKEVANILKKHFRKNDIVGRLGGDEFCVMMFGEYTKERIKEAAGKVCEAVNSIGGFEDDGRPFSCSVGIVTVEGDADYEQLYQMADRALYRTKAKGKNGYTVYGYN